MITLPSRLKVYGIIAAVLASIAIGAYFYHANVVASYEGQIADMRGEMTSNAEKLGAVEALVQTCEQTNQKLIGREANLALRCSDRLEKYEEVTKETEARKDEFLNVLTMNRPPPVVCKPAVVKVPVPQAKENTSHEKPTPKADVTVNSVFNSVLLDLANSTASGGSDDGSSGSPESDPEAATDRAASS